MTITRQGPLLIAALLIVSLVLLWINETYPLSDVHWDSPIYLMKGKNYSEGPYITHLREQAPLMHDALINGEYLKYRSEPSSGDIWGFARLGHTMLVGTLVSILGPNELSIYVITWMYRMLFAIALFFSAMLSIELAARLGGTLPITTVYCGSFVSMSLFLLSDIAGYMSGNLVSEIPAILFLSVSCWALAKSYGQRSYAYAFVSGVFAFLVFLARMETVWVYLTFLVSLAGLLFIKQIDTRGYWKILLVSALTAFLLFLIHSWYFFPLTDPRVMLLWVAATQEMHGTGGERVHVVKQLIAANGLLWIGALLVLPHIRKSAVSGFGLVWLSLALVPAALSFMNEQNTQSRMYTILIPVLILLSTLGWAYFFRSLTASISKVKISIVSAICVFFVLISQPFTYSLLRQLPGFWRLQYVREWVTATAWERIDYYLPELVHVRTFLDSREKPFLVVAGPEMQRADHIMIVQYLDEGRAANKNSKSADQRKDNVLGEEVYLAKERVGDVKYLGSLSKEIQIFLLGKSVEKDWSETYSSSGQLKQELSTEHFTVVALYRSP